MQTVKYERKGRTGFGAPPALHATLATEKKRTRKFANKTPPAAN